MSALSRAMLEFAPSVREIIFGRRKPINAPVPSNSQAGEVARKEGSDSPSGEPSAAKPVDPDRGAFHTLRLTLYLIDDEQYWVQWDYDRPITMEATYQAFYRWFFGRPQSPYFVFHTKDSERMIQRNRIKSFEIARKFTDNS